MKRILMLVVIAIATTGCYSSNDAHKALSAHGFTNITVRGYQPFACGKNDKFSTAFTATNAQGMEVKGTVCSGLLVKNATIRW